MGLTIPKALLAVTRELVGKVVCSSYVTHQKAISYCWILVITHAYSPLKSTSSTTAFNRHERSWIWSISLASDPTRSWILLCSQIFLGWSWFTPWPRMWFGTVINRSQVTLEIFVSCKVLPNHTGNSRRSHPGCMSVAYRSQSIIGHRGSVVTVSRRSGCGCGSGAWVYADKLTNGSRGSRARKSVMVYSQVTLITLPIIYFLYSRMSVAPRHLCKR